MNEKYPEKGFTLLELMATVAIVGTLSTLAMPFYNNYVAKSQVAEGFVLMGPAKNAVAEYCQNNGVHARDNLEAALPNPSLITGKFVDQVTVANGVIRARFSNNAHPDLRGKIVSLFPDGCGSAGWSCKTDIQEGRRPANCLGSEGEQDHYPIDDSREAFCSFGDGNPMNREVVHASAPEGMTALDAMRLTLRFNGGVTTGLGLRIRHLPGEPRPSGCSSMGGKGGCSGLRRDGSLCGRTTEDNHYAKIFEKHLRNIGFDEDDFSIKVSLPTEGGLIWDAAVHLTYRDTDGATKSESLSVWDEGLKAEGDSLFHMSDSNKRVRASRCWVKNRREHGWESRRLVCE